MSSRTNESFRPLLSTEPGSLSYLISKGILSAPKLLLLGLSDHPYLPAKSQPALAHCSVLEDAPS